MAAVTRENLHVIRISRKVILAEVTKKLGGTEPQYECWNEHDKFCSVARTIIASREPNTCGRLEQIMGSFGNTIEAAEEEAAGALLDLLKRNYKLEIDDTNFMQRARIQCQKKNLERYMQAAICTQQKQGETICQLRKGWDRLLGDMETAQQECEVVCGTVLSISSIEDALSTKTEIGRMLCQLNEWLEEKIYESTANLKETIEQPRLGT